LKIGKKLILDIKNGEGSVVDEEGKSSPQKYKSQSGALALGSAGNFGDKPITAKLAESINSWEFYNLDPDMMKKEEVLMFLSAIGYQGKKKKLQKFDSQGTQLKQVAQFFAENEPETFALINEKLYDTLRLKLVLETTDRKPTIKVIEGTSSESLPWSSISDGTLRFIAYFVLLHRTNSDLPSLICIEEPERNLHPGLLNALSLVLKQLSRKTQVVITTHSSQLLDCFKPEEIRSNVSITLLKKVHLI
jgi:predicted ATPase